MNVLRVTHLIALWLAAGTALTPIAVAIGSQDAGEKVIHEAPPSFVPLAAVVALEEQTVLMSPETRETFEEGVNVFDLGELTMDEVIRNVGEDVALSPDPDRVGWVRSMGIQPIRTDDLRLLSPSSRDGSSLRGMVIRSAGAHGIRIHFREFDVPDGEVVLFPDKPAGVPGVGPYSKKGPNDNGDFWSALLPGDTVLVEVRGRGAPHFAITEVVHWERPLDPLPSGGTVASGPLGCHLDAMCSDDISDAARLATGRMTYVVGGQAKNCTGTLLNDLDHETIVPYFLTAYHCISTQAVASTLQVDWAWEREYCGGPLPTVLESTNGATLLATDDTDDGNDMSFLRLNGPLPGGLALAGWTTGHPDSAYGIHHPAGSWKRVTYLSGVGACPGCPLCGDTFDYDFYDMDNGIIEGGSSGSGIFNFSGQLFGQLNGYCCLYASCAGEDISCSSVDEYVAIYGEFETTYPLIEWYLTVGGTLHVDGAAAPPGLGTPEHPYTQIGFANLFAWPGARIKIAAGSYNERLTLDKRVVLVSAGGTVRVGP